jgi:hypothetical protein
MGTEEYHSNPRRRPDPPSTDPSLTDLVLERRAESGFAVRAIRQADTAAPLARAAREAARASDRR